MSGTKGSEAAAIQILTRAIQLDGEMKFNEAVTCYEQGIRILLQVVKEIESEEKRDHFKKKIDEYLKRAEIMKKAAVKEQKAQQTHKQIRISANAKGYGYSKIFSSLIDEIVTSVLVQDAYIRNIHQTKVIEDNTIYVVYCAHFGENQKSLPILVPKIQNLLRFCELLIKEGENMRRIVLNTSPCTENHKLQIERLNELKMSLKNQGVDLEFNFLETLHDREIRFNNGWIIKIGRGLDYFKRPDGKFSLGNFDLDLRSCHETIVDIFHKSALNTVTNLQK